MAGGNEYGGTCFRTGRLTDKTINEKLEKLPSQPSTDTVVSRLGHKKEQQQKQQQQEYEQ